MKSYSYIYFRMIIFAVLLSVMMACKNKSQVNSQNSTSDQVQRSKLNPDAPQETAQMGKLIGVWNSEQSFVNRDGTWDDKKSKAIWKFYYILNGHAIQDDWIVSDSLGNQNVVGTNIRIYNPDEKQWYMAWIDITNRRLATFTATSENENIIMSGYNAKGKVVRNTFNNMTHNSFDWAQEWTNDDGNTWFTVTKIHNVRQN